MTPLEESRLRRIEGAARAVLLEAWADQTGRIQGHQALIALDAAFAFDGGDAPLLWGISWQGQPPDDRMFLSFAPLYPARDAALAACERLHRRQPWTAYTPSRWPAEQPA